MKPLGKTYQEATVSNNNRIVPGGYIAEIIKVTDMPMNPKTGKGDYLKIDFDITEGEYADYFSEMSARLGWDNGNFIRSYKESAMGMFKGFLQTIDKANGSNFETEATIGLDEQDLCGCVMGIILGEEEYRKNDGSVGTKTVVTSVVDPEKISKGDYKVPDKKLLNDSKSAAASTFGATVSDDDIPFV